MKAEFDTYTQDYRKNLDTDLFLTGGTSKFFAQYKAKKLKEFTISTGVTPRNILDFGCGDGLMTKEVLSLYPKSEIHGVDLSSKIIEFAKSTCPGIFFQTSGTKLNIFRKNKNFDLIFSSMVFHHIPFFEHRHYVEEINSILSPNGIFIIFELNPFNPVSQYIINTAKIDINAHMLMPWYTTKLLQPYGKVTRKYCGYFPPFLNLLFPLERYLEKIPLGAFSVTILEKQ